MWGQIKDTSKTNRDIKRCGIVKWFALTWHTWSVSDISFRRKFEKVAPYLCWIWLFYRMMANPHSCSVARGHLSRQSKGHEIAISTWMELCWPIYYMTQNAVVTKEEIVMIDSWFRQWVNLRWPKYNFKKTQNTNRKKMDWCESK